MPALMIREDLPPGELRRLAKTERDLRVARRLLAIVAALEGMSQEAAARVAGMDRKRSRTAAIFPGRTGDSLAACPWAHLLGVHQGGMSRSISPRQTSGRGGIADNFRAGECSIVEFGFQSNAKRANEAIGLSGHADDGQ